MSSVITLTTDFGLRDPFVGIMRPELRRTPFGGTDLWSGRGDCPTYLVESSDEGS